MDWDYSLDLPPTICDKCGRESTDECLYDDDTDTCPKLEGGE